MASETKIHRCKIAIGLHTFVLATGYTSAVSWLLYITCSHPWRHKPSNCITLGRKYYREAITSWQIRIHSRPKFRIHVVLVSWMLCRCFPCYADNMRFALKRCSEATVHTTSIVSLDWILTDARHSGIRGNALAERFFFYLFCKYQWWIDRICPDLNLTTGLQELSL